MRMDLEKSRILEKEDMDDTLDSPLIRRII
jgi:hypothetical protein